MFEVVKHSVDVLALLVEVDALHLDSVQLDVDGLLLLLQQFLLLCQLALSVKIRMVQMRLLRVHFRHYAVKLHLCLTLAGFILCPDFFLVHSSFVL